MTATRIQITEGKAVLYVDGKVAAGISERDFTLRVGKHYIPPQSFFPIPNGVRFYVFEGSRAVLVVEIEPSVHNVSIANGKSRNLAFPFLVFVIPFFEGKAQTHQCSLFYRNTALASWDDALCYTNLQNVFKDLNGVPAYVSFGSDYHQPTELSWQGAIEDVVRRFLWSAFYWGQKGHPTFRSHFAFTKEGLCDDRVLDIEKWEVESEKNPSFPLSVLWVDAGFTLSSAVQTTLSRLPRCDISLPNLIQEP